MNPVKWFKRQRDWVKWTLVSILAVIVIARFALPFVIKKYINDQLADLDGYTGYVEDVDIFLITGSYNIDGIHIYEESIIGPEPFLMIEELELSIQWDRLLAGSLVGEAIFNKPRINLIWGEPAHQDQSDSSSTNNFSKAEDAGWREALLSLIPIKLNRVVINDGSIHYKDYISKPNLDLHIVSVNGEFNNLTNSLELSKDLVSSGSIDGKLMGYAPISLNLHINPFEEYTFDMDCTIEKLDLTRLNDYFNTYANIDVESGEFNLYMEMAVNKGKSSGYYKPLIKNPKIFSLKNDKDRFVREMLFGALGTTITNIRRKQMATKIFFEGDFGDPDIKTWKMIGYFLKNMFIKALKPGVEQAINFNSVDPD